MRSTEERVAALLADALEASGRSQAALARRIGVSAKHLNLVLNGKATARSQALDYWAFALGLESGVSLAEIKTPAAGACNPTGGRDG
jgi:transcriptional regulator with XRE-family HTH domain